MSNDYIDQRDILDVRDIAATIREVAAVFEDEDEDTYERSEALKALEAYAEAFPGMNTPEEGDWDALADAWGELDGPTAIAESYFTEYAEELCKDLGELPREVPGYIVIDWEATADNLKADYTNFTLDGTDYLIRL